MNNDKLIAMYNSIEQLANEAIDNSRPAMWSIAISLKRIADCMEHSRQQRDVQMRKAQKLIKSGHDAISKMEKRSR